MTRPYPLIITNNELLDDWCGTLEKYDPVAVDTEGDSLHCYFEKLCLIQIRLPEQDILIDPLEPLDFSRFNTVLAQRKVILHGCDFDLRMLRRGTKFVPGEVFDTYLAARLVGLKEVGLASLVKEFFGIELPKSSQKANWARRPLTPAMIEYAINDTLYLIDLAERLAEDLRAKGRWDWFEESCQKAVSAAGEDREKDPERIWKISGSAALRGRELAILRALWHWRDGEAQKADRPSFQILRNEELIELAKSAEAGSLLLPRRRPRDQAETFSDGVGGSTAFARSGMAATDQVGSRPANRGTGTTHGAAQKSPRSGGGRIATRSWCGCSAAGAGTDLERTGNGRFNLMRWQQQLLGL